MIAIISILLIIIPIMIPIHESSDSTMVCKQINSTTQICTPQEQQIPSNLQVFYEMPYILMIGCLGLAVFFIFRMI